MGDTSIPYQTGVLAYRTNSGRFLVLRLKNGDLDALKRQVVKFYETRHLFTYRQPDLVLNTALSFGYDLWSRPSPRRHHRPPARLYAVYGRGVLFCPFPNDA